MELASLLNDGSVVLVVGDCEYFKHLEPVVDIGTHGVVGCVILEMNILVFGCWLVLDVYGGEF